MHTNMVYSASSYTYKLKTYIDSVCYYFIILVHTSSHMKTCLLRKFTKLLTSRLSDRGTISLHNLCTQKKVHVNSKFKECHNAMPSGSNTTSRPQFQLLSRYVYNFWDCQPSQFITFLRFRRKYWNSSCSW